MPSNAQQAFAEGFCALLADHGLSWSFAYATFDGIVSPLKPNDPRMSGSSDRLFEVRALTSALPNPRPARGDVIATSGKYHRITRPLDDDLSTGITTILVAET